MGNASLGSGIEQDNAINNAPDVPVDSKVRAVEEDGVMFVRGLGEPPPTNSAVSQSETNELAPHERLAKRQTYIASIKSTAGYESYRASKASGEEEALKVPVTPNPQDQSVSKRQWEESCRIWRTAIKQFEGKEKEKEQDIPVLKMAELLPESGLAYYNSDHDAEMDMLQEHPDTNDCVQPSTASGGKSCRKQKTELSADERTHKRQIYVASIKGTEGYKAYAAHRANKAREGGECDDPGTPDTQCQNISKRQWEESCRIWRNAIKPFEE